MSRIDRTLGHGDAGVATVWAAIAVAALLTLSGGLFWLGGAMNARHRAAGAADLAALAAAGRAQAGTAEACDRARFVAERMGARVRECRLLAWDALVQVEIDLPGPAAAFGAAAARARAGPVQPVGQVVPGRPGDAPAPVGNDDATR